MVGKQQEQECLMEFRYSSNKWESLVGSVTKEGWVSSCKVEGKSQHEPLIQCSCQAPTPSSYKPIYFVIFQCSILQPGLGQFASLTGQASHAKGGWHLILWFYPVVIKAAASNGRKLGKMEFTRSPSQSFLPIHPQTAPGIPSPSWHR